MRLNTDSFKAIRIAGGDSLRSLSERTGISKNSLNLIEQGKTQPRASTIYRLAQALSVPVGAITTPDEHKAVS